jgi:hypothetical protein
VGVGGRTITLNAIGFEEVNVKDEAGNQLVWTYDGERIIVTWAEPIAKGQERKLHGTSAPFAFVCDAAGKQASKRALTRVDLSSLWFGLGVAQWPTCWTTL